MKRAWIALAILCAVFAAALYNGHVLRGFTEELTGLLTLAQTQAEHDAWNEADELTRAAAEKWEAQDAPPRRHRFHLHLLPGGGGIFGKPGAGGILRSQRPADCPD